MIGGAVVDRHRESVGKLAVVRAHDPHSRLWSARVRAHRVRVPDRRRRVGRVRARRAAERGRPRRLPARGRARLRAVRRRALAGGHPRRAPARLLARVGDRARGPLPAARADHGRLLGAQRVRRAGRCARPTTTSGARAGATRPSRPYLERAERELRVRRFADEELSPWHRAFAQAAGADAHRAPGQRRRRRALEHRVRLPRWRPGPGESGDPRRHAGRSRPARPATVRPASPPPTASCTPSTSCSPPAPTARRGSCCAATSARRGGCRSARG